MAVNDDPFRLFLPSFHSPEPLDPTLAGSIEQSDTDFFNSAYNTAFNSPGEIFPDDGLSNDASQALLDNRRPNAMNPVDSYSPESSPPDSSSDTSTRLKRNDSSNSSQSGLLAGDLSMTDDVFPAAWRGGLKTVEDKFAQGPKSEIPSADADVDMSNRAMEDDFDFESAASSPSPPLDLETLSSSGIRGLKMPIRSPRPRPASNLNHQYGVPKRTYETCPSTTMMKGQDAWASGSIDTLPTSTNFPQHNTDTYSQNGLPQVTPLQLTNPPANYDGSGSVSPAMTFYATSGMPFASHLAMAGSSYASAASTKLLVHPVRDKSRVETQIAIKLTLFPMPPGITKLHLQPHAISKPKLIAKPTPSKSPEMLEMYTMLVCTSAMQDPAKVQRALARAAGSSTTRKVEGRRSSSESSPSPDDDENKPLNGGPVNICAGCITRERKRASRKKSKNKEEEEMWQEDEAKRIIVFNTHEVKDWQSPLKCKSGSQTVDANTSGSEHSPPPTGFPEDAMQVDLPMRIACYCRHQEEKLGFQVIFTLKDHQDKVVAQAMSNSIVVTDDHKNPSDKAKDAAAAIPAKLSKPAEIVQFPSAGVFPRECFGPLQYTHAHSSSDLHALPHNSKPYFTQHITHFNNPQITSQPGSASTTPFNLSRPPSPSLHTGPQSKRRKTSGVGKLPDGLTMTRLPSPHVPNISASGRAPTELLSGSRSHAPNQANFPVTMDHSLHYSTHSRFPRSMNAGSTTSSAFQPNANPPLPSFHSSHTLSSPSDPNPSAPNNNLYSIYPSASSTNPPTPNNNDYNFFANAQRSQSMDDLSVLHGTPSASGIALQNPMSNSTFGHQNANFDMSRTQAQPTVLTTPGIQNTSISLRNHAQALANSLNGLPGAIVAPYQPTILEVFPASGPKSGGIKIILLGSGFREGLEVVFGTALAPTTTHWGEKCLVCTLPPSTEEMTVRVTLLDRLQQAQLDHQQPIQFRYVDDNKQQLMELALAFLNHKYTGRDEHAEDVARNILNSLSSSNTGAGRADVNLPQVPTSNAEMLGSMDLEASLMRCLDLVDLADSSFKAQLNAQRPNGQSMLHFSASIGYLRLVAGLLARGADPDLRDNGGFTPMHMAALNGHLQIVRKLRSSGGDPTLRSLRGATPADMATLREIHDIASTPDHHTRSRSAGATMISRQSRVSDATTPISSWKVRSVTELMDPEDSFGGKNDEGMPEDDGAMESHAHLPSKPPAYEEIYPLPAKQDHDMKKASSIRALGEALLDQKCIDTFDGVEAGASSVPSAGKIREGENVTTLGVIPKEVKRLRSDRKLWCIWIPLLILVGLAMLKDWVPQLRLLAHQPLKYLQERFMV